MIRCIISPNIKFIKAQVEIKGEKTWWQNDSVATLSDTMMHWLFIFCWLIDFIQLDSSIENKVSSDIQYSETLNCPFGVTFTQANLTIIYILDFVRRGLNSRFSLCQVFYVYTRHPRNWKGIVIEYAPSRHLCVW